MKQTPMMKKYFPESLAIRREICAAKQENGESLHGYWERFKRLCAYPHHSIPEEFLIQFFYVGQFEDDQRLLDIAARGALLKKTADEARHLIEKMAANSAPFAGTDAESAESQLEHQRCQQLERLEHQIVELTKMIAKMSSEGGHEYTGYPNLSWGNTNYDNYDPAVHILQQQQNRPPQQFSQPSQLSELLFTQPHQTYMPQQYQRPEEKGQLDEILELMRDMNHRFDWLEKTVGETSMKVAKLESKIEEQFSSQSVRVLEERQGSGEV